MARFTKQALDVAALLQRLLAKGLVIADQAEAEQALEFIGYFRLRGYGLRFTVLAPAGFAHGTRVYRRGTTFRDILAVYRFDSELRALILREIEKIEIAVRSVINDQLSRSHGPHWYLDLHRSPLQPARARDWYQQVTGDAFKSKESYIEHYFRTYSDPPLPPFWAISECLSFGQWSRLFAALRSGRSAIAARLGLSEPILASWLHSLTVLRNICAHHGRLVDRNLPHPPRAHPHHRPHFAQQHRLYPHLVAIQILLKKIEPAPDFAGRLGVLLRQGPVTGPELGFIPAWDASPPWT